MRRVRLHTPVSINDLSWDIRPAFVPVETSNKSYQDSWPRASQWAVVRPCQLLARAIEERVSSTSPSKEQGN